MRLFLITMQIRIFSVTAKFQVADKGCFQQRGWREEEKEGDLRWNRRGTGVVENSKDEFVVFENENQQKLIISSKDAGRVTPDILKRNNIPSRYSEDVGLWVK